MTIKLVYPEDICNIYAVKYDKKKGFSIDSSPSNKYIAIYYELNKKEVWEKKTHEFTFPLDELDCNNAEWANTYFGSEIYPELVPNRGRRLYGDAYLRTLSIETYNKEVKK